MNKIEKGLKLAQIFKLVASVLVLLSFSIPLFPAITLSSSGTKKTFGSAYSFIFGGKISTTNTSYSARGISGICLAAFIILVLTIIVLAYSTFAKRTRIPKSILTFASALLLITSSILFLCAHRSVSNVLADALIGDHSDSVSNTIYSNTSMNFGIWGIAVFDFASSFLLLASLIFDGSWDKFRAKIGAM